MTRVDDLIKDACEDQKPALRRFAETGDKADAAAVHYESCPICMNALEEVALHIARRPPPALIEGDRAWVKAVYVGTRALPVVLIAALVWFGRSAISDDGPPTAAERMEARIRYVRMPGHPQICVATLPGNGGFGPTFIGAARCTRVHDRVEFDEEASFDLGRFTIVPIDGTSECLAYDEEKSFSFPCAPDDD